MIDNAKNRGVMTSLRLAGANIGFPCQEQLIITDSPKVAPQFLFVYQK